MPAPWSDAQIREELDAANGRSWVLLQEGAVTGYAFFRTCPPECELLHLVVAPERRRQGLARQLLNMSLARLAAAGCTCCLLEVRESNNAARQLYAGLAFIEVGRRRGYYRHPCEDALLLRRESGC